LSELFLIEEQSIWILLDIISKPDGLKRITDIEFYHRLFDVVIDLESECGDWLLLLKRLEISTMFSQGAK
jgi:hypothetical protein